MATNTQGKSLELKDVVALIVKTARLVSKIILAVAACALAYLVLHTVLQLLLPRAIQWRIVSPIDLAYLCGSWLALAWVLWTNEK